MAKATISFDGQPLMLKASSPADPDYANWNAGHFKPAPTPTPAQPAILAPPPGLPTQANTNIPLRLRVRALQIKIRLWDRKTSQTRQVTIIRGAVSPDHIPMLVAAPPQLSPSKLV